MAASMVGELEAERSCCSKLKKKVTKLEEGRACLRKCVEILEDQVKKLQSENAELKKVCVEVRARSESEREAKENELSRKEELEKEICNLKERLSALTDGSHSSVKNEVADRMQVPCIFEREAEIIRLTELLVKERERGDSEWKKEEKAQNQVNAEKKKAADAMRQLKVEKSKREEEKRHTQLEKDRAEEYKLYMEKLKTQIDELRMEVESERTKAVEANRRAEVEKQKSDKEKRSADLQMNRAKEYRLSMEALKEEIDKMRTEVVSERTKAEVANRRVEVEKQKADREKKRADLEMEKSEEQRKSAGIERKKRMDEKSLADHLSQQLAEEKQRREALEKDIQEIKSRFCPDRRVGTMKETMLKQQLKLEKLRVKHTKRIAEEERMRKSLMQQEMHLLKQDVFQFSHRLNLIEGCFSYGTEGIGGPVEAGDSAKQLTVNLKRKLLDKKACDLYCQSELELGQTGNSTLNGLNCCGPLLEHIGPSLPISGISSELLPLIGGSVRKKSQNSAISTAASFSDRQLVGSQGRDAFSVAKSTELFQANSKQESTIERLSGKNYDISSFINETHAHLPRQLVSPSSTPILEDKIEMSDKHSKKIKMSREVLESTVHLFPNDTRSRLKNEEKLSSRDDILGLKSDMPFRNDRNSDPLGKERMVTNEQGIVSQSQPPDRDKEEGQRCNLEIGCSGDLAAMPCFIDMIGMDCLKLLEMDNDADEEIYKMARERPLSPILPEFDFNDLGVSDAEDSRLATINNNSGPSQIFGVTSKEIDPNNVGFEISEASHSPLLHEFKGQCIEPVEEPVNSYISIGERAHGTTPKYCVVFPDIKDDADISRIFCCMESCIALCSMVAPEDWMVAKLLLALASQKDLQPEEKARVFFSMLLYNFSVVDSANSSSLATGDPSVYSDHLVLELRKVIFEVETRCLFLEVCQPDILLGVIESFLIDGRVIVFIDVPYEQMVGKCFPLDGRTLSVSSKTATVVQLVAGSIILASFCTVLDRVGFLWEASFNILRKCKHDCFRILTVLHIFTSVCGRQYFVQSNCHLLVSTVQSIISFLERGDKLTDSWLKFPSCEKCPFSDGMISLDKVITLLLDKLQDYAVSGIRHQSPRKSIASSSCTVEMDFFYLSDTVSLVELVSYYMGWDWSYNTIIPYLWKVLESSAFEEASAAILILIGQLGRLGIDANGYEQKGVEELRCNLSAFLDMQSKHRQNLPIQIAAVNALVNLLLLEFGEAVQNGTDLLCDERRLSHLMILRRWFSELSKEDQLFSLSLFRSADEQKI